MVVWTLSLAPFIFISEVQCLRKGVKRYDYPSVDHKLESMDGSA